MIEINDYEEIEDYLRDIWPKIYEYCLNEDLDIETVLKSYANWIYQLFLDKDEDEFVVFQEWSMPKKVTFLFFWMGGNVHPDLIAISPFFQSHFGWYSEARANLMKEKRTLRKEVFEEQYVDLGEELITAITIYSIYTGEVADGARWKRWNTRKDNKVRIVHQELEGVRIPIMANFSNSLGSIRFPHDPEATTGNTIGCRCFLTFE